MFRIILQYPLSFQGCLQIFDFKFVNVLEMMMDTEVSETTQMLRCCSEMCNIYSTATKIKCSCDLITLMVRFNRPAMENFP